MSKDSTMHVINVDWMQVFCKGELLQPHYADFKIADYGTKIFETLITVFIDHEEYCIIMLKPRSTIISQDTIIIKLINKQLYKPSAFTKFQQFISDCNIRFISFSRIDIAADFNTFYNNLNPNNFVTNFLTNKYLKTKKSKFTIRGNQKNTNEYDYLRIGSATSDISAYLYNKTKEMQEVKEKPYIFEMWQASGLDTSKNVYRLEVTIKNFKMKFRDDMGQDYSRFTIIDFDNSNFLASLFYAGINTSFRFKHNDNTVNKSRMQDVILFKNAENFEAIKFDTDKIESSKYTKGVINYLERMNNEVRALRQIERTKFSVTAEMIAEQTNLKKWYDERYLTNNQEPEKPETNLNIAPNLDFLNP